ncbi:14475_t:CDS:2, partial [Racocetra fulgida]
FLFETKNQNEQEYRECVLNFPYRFLAILGGEVAFSTYCQKFVTNLEWQRRVAGHTKITNLNNQIARINQKIS